MIWCLTLALGLAHAGEDEAPRKENWLTRIRYGIGVVASGGGGMHVGPDRFHGVVEPVAFELRSYFTPNVAWHTTLNLTRMILPAATRQVGRLDYDLHVAAHLPVAERTEVVVGPGASIAYGFAGSTYERFVGDVRVGFDVHSPERRWTWGVYVRPYVGWITTDPTDGTAPVSGVGAGALAEVAWIWQIPRPRDRRREASAAPGSEDAGGEP